MAKSKARVRTRFDVETARKGVLLAPPGYLRSPMPIPTNPNADGRSKRPTMIDEANYKRIDDSGMITEEDQARWPKLHFCVELDGLLTEETPDFCKCFGHQEQATPKDPQ